MEENDVLYRLKELEMLERIFDKVGNINVDGGNFIESLENIVGTRRKEKQKAKKDAFASFLFSALNHQFAHHIRKFHIIWKFEAFH